MFVGIELFLEVLVSICIAVPVVIFGVYGSVLFYYNKKPWPARTGAQPTNYPSISIVVATHNEESIIAKKIENFLSLDYPRGKLEIIFSDDSNDSTPKIIQKYSDVDPSIHLIHFDQRMGYSPSMIAGVKAAKGEITVLGDAGSFLDAQALKRMVVHFEDPSVGAVTGNDVILNTSEHVGQSESLYQKAYNFIRSAEMRMDSTFYIKGEATAVRSSLIADFDRCFETFDTAVGLFIRQKGFKTVYDPDVKFYEYSASNRPDRVKQKTIRATNLIRVLFRFRSMMFKRRYGKFGMVILPMNFAMLAIAPMAILAWFVLLFPLALFNFLFSAVMWGIIAALAVGSLAVSKSLLSTFVDLEYSLMKAIYKIVVTRASQDKIETVASTRRVQASVP